jgi:DNA-binding GntR family transcriptional regulator
MNGRPRRKTLSDEAYEAISVRIIDGRLAAGTRLIVAGLADELQLSATPINEALSALDREGLVSYEPHRGYSVREMTLGDIDEVFTVREAIEGLAVHLATQRVNAATVSRLEQLLKQAATAVKRKEFATFYELDMEFHRTILRASGNSLVARIAEMIHGQMHLLTGKAVYTPGRFKGAHVEHEAVMRCMRVGDAEAAEKAMRSHIRNAKEALIAAARMAASQAAGATEPLHHSPALS